MAPHTSTKKNVLEENKLAARVLRTHLMSFSTPKHNVKSLEELETRSNWSKKQSISTYNGCVCVCHHTLAYLSQERPAGRTIVTPLIFT